MKDWILTIDDLLDRHPPGERREGRVYKFVKVDGSFRFVEIEGFLFCPAHADLVEEDETAECAGNIRVVGHEWHMLQWYSQTLKIHATPEDADDLTALLGRPLKG